MVTYTVGTESVLFPQILLYGGVPGGIQGGADL